VLVWLFDGFVSADGGAALKRRTLLLTSVLLLGSFQAGRLAERAIWPCRLRPFAAVVAPLLAQAMPSPQMCELLLQLPSW
jgi:hypothetical protein